jgi:hypothetical protein
MSTYGQARERFMGELGHHTLDQLVERSGATRLGPDRLGLRCLGRDYVIGYPNGVVTTAAGDEVDDHLAILLLLYLVEATGPAVEGHWVAFEQLSGGAGYIGSFRGRCLMPFLRTFGSRPEALLPAAESLDASPLAMGDAAVSIPGLPRVPIAFVLWRGDDEFPPSASLVFDASIGGYLDAEAATVLAELATHALIDAARGGQSEGEPR